MPEETAEERRARKAAEREANHQRFAKEVEELTKPLPPNLTPHELQAEHTRLRTKIMEMQQLVITGRFAPQVANENQRRLIEQIHKVEELAHRAMAGGGGLPGEADRDPNRTVR